MNEKYCGNCKHFKGEDAEGWGWCSFNNTKTHCAQAWDCHNSTFNGWTEITPDNVDEINADLIAVTDGTYYKMANDWHASLSTLAKVGGYYYLVLPELKLEETK